MINLNPFAISNVDIEWDKFPSCHCFSCILHILICCIFTQFFEFLKFPLGFFFQQALGLESRSRAIFVGCSSNDSSIFRHSVVLFCSFWFIWDSQGSLLVLRG